VSAKSTQTIGPYPVDVVLGSGSFGTVYRGWHPTTGDLLAIKVLDPERHADPASVRAQLHREAAAMRAVSDPHCVRVWDVVDLPAYAAIVSDFIDGVSLRVVLRRDKRLDGPQALSVLLGSLHGLAAVHRVGLVHGDVKPENILLDRTGTSRLVDFGLASRTRPAGSSSGTPAYQSPEQILGRDVDARSDLFSAAMVLYELLCGRRPFQARSIAELYDLHLHTDAPDPRTFQPDLADELAELCVAGLSRDPAARPQTAEEFVSRLERAARQRYGPGWFATTAVATAGLGAAVKMLAAAAPAPIVATVGAGTAGTAGGVALGAGAGAGISSTSALGIGAAAVGVVAAVGGGTVAVVHHNAPEPEPRAAAHQPTIHDVDLATLTWYDAFSGTRITARQRTSEADLPPEDLRHEVDAPAAYSDVDGDGDQDAIASLTTSVGNGYQTVWYVWLWDTKRSAPQQVKDPIVEAARCGTQVRSIKAAAEGGFTIQESLRDFNGTESCAEEPPTRTSRTVRVVDGMPVLGDDPGGYGGYCPQPTAPGDGGMSTPADVGDPAVHVAPTAGSPTVSPSRVEWLGLLEQPTSWLDSSLAQAPWTTRDGWELVYYRLRGDDGSGPLPCAWIRPVELTHPLGYLGDL
jgi:hypothetical protein